MRTILPTFQLTPANASAIADICIALDGLPLALELAAARVKTLPPQALLARLSQRLALLTGGARTLPERQQTLRNTLHWSYDLLSPQEQWLFRLLAVFVGGCTLEAVEAVAAALTGTPASLLDAVAALVDKSLLVPLATEREEPRFRMLETVREYGLECLRTRGESKASGEAHANYYLALAEQADAHLKGRGQQAQWLRWLIQEQANLRAALSWFFAQQDAQSMLRLSGVLWWFWTIQGASSEALEWLQTALRLPEADAPTAARARALCSAGYMTGYLHNHRRESIAMLSESVTLYRQLGEQHGLAETFGWFAQVQMYLKDYSAARALAEEGIALSEAVGERRFVAFNHSMMALVIEKQGDEAEAVAQWERSLALGRELDEHTGLVARALRHLASLAYAHGDFAYSRALLEENLAIAREAGKASNCPPIPTVRLDAGGFVLTSSSIAGDGKTGSYGPRRSILDKILIDAADSAGAEVREGFLVQEALMDGDRAIGIRGRGLDGATVSEKASIVVGADGMRSLVARSVHAPTYHSKPTRTCCYFAYWSDVPVEGIEMYLREQRVIFAFPTNDTLTCIVVAWPIQELQTVRADIEGNFLKTIALAPGLLERVQYGRRGERFRGSADLPNFYRKPYGPGWVLVGDAGYHKDPYLAQGITDAFRHGELVAAAIDAGFAGRQELQKALAHYERQRNEETLSVYEWNYHLASLDPPSPQMQQLLGTLCGNRDETNRFFGTLAGTVPHTEFFALQHLGRIPA